MKTKREQLFWAQGFEAGVKEGKKELKRDLKKFFWGPEDPGEKEVNPGALRSLVEDLASQPCPHVGGKPDNGCLPCRARWELDNAAIFAHLDGEVPPITDRIECDECGGTGEIRHAEYIDDCPYCNG